MSPETGDEMCDCIRGEDEPLHEFQDRCSYCDQCHGWGRKQALRLKAAKLQDWADEGDSR